MNIAIRAATLSLLLSLAGTAGAEPTIDQIYQASKSGNLQTAQTMIKEVLKAHPESAKAHFVQAEIFSRAGNQTDARAELDTACEYGTRLQRDRSDGQAQLFGAVEEDAGGAATNGAGGLNLPAAAPWTESDQLRYEKETIGLYLSGHPVDRYAHALRNFGAKTVADLAEAQPAPESADGWGPGGRKLMEADTSVGGGRKTEPGLPGSGSGGVGSGLPCFGGRPAGCPGFGVVWEGSVPGASTVDADASA